MCQSFTIEGYEEAEGGRGDDSGSYSGKAEKASRRSRAQDGIIVERVD
jgi:hypothetical protein